MPGKNSLFHLVERPWYDDLVQANMHIYTIVMVHAVELVGMIRFYFIYPELRYSPECLTILVFVMFINFMCFSGMLKAKYDDPGYLIPGTEEELVTLKKGSEKTDTGDDDTKGLFEESCKKCSYKRTHSR